MATQHTESVGAAWQGLIEEVPGQPPLRARIAGTGIEVWEVMKGYREVAEDWTRLRAGFDWLTEEQLRAALAFYAAYPETIDEQLALDDRADELLHELWERHPDQRPPVRLL